MGADCSAAAVSALRSIRPESSFVLDAGAGMLGFEVLAALVKAEREKRTEDSFRAPVAGLAAGGAKGLAVPELT